MFDIGTGSLINIKSAKNGNIPRISVQTSDNGIVGYFDENVENARYFENFISVNFFGLSYYHPYRASVEMKVHTLKLKNRIFSKEVGTFISAVINKKFEGIFSYGSQLSSSKLKNNDYRIKLPTKNGKIDFEFIESFISKFEIQTLINLESYLKATELTDYNLSVKEKKAINDFENSKIQFGEFIIGNIFSIKNTLSFNKDKLTEGEEFDYITRTSQNQGIFQKTNFVNKENINSPGNWSLGLLQMDFFYRNRPWYAGQFIRKIIPQVKLERGGILFFTALLNKQKPNLLSVLVRDVDEKFKNTKLGLPINVNNEIDFEFIETFISAIQKLVIKDVILFIDNKIVR